MTPGLHEALGDGWLKDVLLAVASALTGGVSAWLVKRPIEKAGVLEAVNSRMSAYMDHIEGEVLRLTQALAACEDRHDRLEEERRRDRDRIDLLTGELRQMKQITSSTRRAGASERGPD